MYTNSWWNDFFLEYNNLEWSLHRWFYRHKFICANGISYHRTCTASKVSSLVVTPKNEWIQCLWSSLLFSPELTWRDVQYLIAYTSNRDKLVGGNWFTNGGGLKVSPKFGFGAIDAEALVTRARRWINVPAQQSMELPLHTTSLQWVSDLNVST